MTYSKEIGGDRIKNGSIGSSDVNTSQVASLADANTWTDANTFQRSVDTQPAIQTRVTGDAVPRLVTAADGKFSWGDGSGAADLTVERGFAGGLRVTGDQIQLFRRAGSPGTFAGMYVLAATSVQTAYSAIAVGDGNFRYRVQASGELSWSDGSGALDTNLYRSGVGELRTDTGLVVGANLQVDGDTALGSAITDLIGLYGAAAVAQAAAIAAPMTPSVAYSQAEAQSAVDAINDIRTALANIGITA